jgi:hypothetical protein
VAGVPSFVTPSSPDSQHSVKADNLVSSFILRGVAWEFRYALELTSFFWILRPLEPDLHLLDRVTPVSAHLPSGALHATSVTPCDFGATSRTASSSGSSANLEHGLEALRSGACHYGHGHFELSLASDISATANGLGTAV